MKIPLLDLKAQYETIKDEVSETVNKVIESQYFILSNEVSGLEGEIADYCGAKYAAGVASGTDAIILALRAAGVGDGDIVLTTPFTFFATAESISILNARPVFVDIDRNTYNICPDRLKGTLDEMSKDDRSRVKAVLPVHLYGQCADMASIAEIADSHGLKIIEDCAQAIGASYKGKRSGTFGAAGCFSFFPSKNLGGFGDGGMITSNDEDLIDRVKLLRVHGSNKQYIHEEIGYNSRLDSLQAAVLRVKLRKLDSWLEGRRSVAAKYNDAFKDLDIVTPQTMEGNVHTFHQYTIALENRDGFSDFLEGKGISARSYYPVPLHLQRCYEGLGYGKGSFPVSEDLSDKIISLPVYPELTDEQTDYVISVVKDFFKQGV